MVYTVPDGLHAIPSPKCVYSASAEVFRSSVEMANSYADKYAYDINISGEIDVDTVVFGAYSASGSYSYSKERSVEAAQSLKQQRSGSIAVGEVICEASKVQQSSLNLHPIFLRDLSLVTNSSDILKLMNKYGTHYYKSATLGGRLRQVTVIDSQFTSKSNEREIKESSKLSLTGAVAGEAYGVKASLTGAYASSKDSTITTEQQRDFESSSSRSRIITYGGPPGSFGPSSSKAPSTFGEWARYVDLLPVPINYQLVPIYNAIHPLWKTRNGTSIRTLWKSAQIEFRDSFGALTEASKGYKYTVFWFFQTNVMAFQPQPAFFDLVFDGQRHRMVDMNGPSGTYSPVGSVANVTNPLRMNFYHPASVWNSTAAPYLNTIADSVNENAFVGARLTITNWQTSTLRTSARIDSVTWQYDPDWTTKLSVYFEISKVEGIDLAENYGHTLEFTIKGDAPNRNFVHLTGFSASTFPSSSTAKRFYFIDIPIVPNNPNRITAVKSVGIRFGTSNTPSSKVTFAVSNLWTAHNIPPHPNTIATVFSMGNGIIMISNYDKAPQQIPMFPLSALY
eukprot:TRINITY_DN2177_c0_g1_i2.p1 TRINITY_DN2177_c0_g1~~TRINITY_DN2177_c0_g1_i2.p1  ORF type:complete len:565 (-),score=41.60 TRINITY_DN2177_c0_g1_i2:843-2537(-)